MTPLNTSSYSQWTPLKFFSEEQEGQDEEEEQEEERNKRNQNQNRTSEFGLSAGRSLISLPHRPLLLLPLLLASGLPFFFLPEPNLYFALVSAPDVPASILLGP